MRNGTDPGKHKLDIKIRFKSRGYENCRPHIRPITITAVFSVEEIQHKPLLTNFRITPILPF